MSYVLVKNNDWTTVTCNNVQVSIPKVWQTAKLRDSVKSYIGGDYGDDTDGEDKSEVDVYTLHVFNTNYEKAIAKRYLRTSKLKGRALDVGDILLEKCGGSPKNPVGRMYQLTKASTRPRTAVNFITILKLVECVDAKYLYAHLRYLYKNGVTRLYEQKTTGIANLKTEDFLNHEIQKPSSLVEQTAIANILSDQEALIAQYDNLIALHEKRFAYLSDELLSGRVRLVQKEVGEVELVRNALWQEKELNGEAVVIPADWTSTALNTYADIISGQSPASDLVADLGLDFHQGNSLFGDKYIKPSTKKIDRTRAPKIAPAHSILFSVRAPVGEVNIACTEMCIGRGLAALTTEHVSEWMYFRLKSMSSVFKKLSTGTTFEGITAKNLGAVTFGCPPLNEQTAIANVLSDQEALIAQYKKLRDAEKKRFDWLSDALLSGTYRVKVEA